MTSLQVSWPRALDGALALAAGSSPAIGSFLAPDVRSWLASPEQGLRAAAESVRGADATAEAPAIQTALERGLSSSAPASVLRRRASPL